MKGVITSIKRLATHDGDGLRTTVFLKGCPLSCKWCHNPEAISFRPQIALKKSKCLLCGECASVCEKNVHIIGGEHKVSDEFCVACGKCERECPAGALTVYGRSVTAEELVDSIAEDEIFFAGGGGVTFSGGEPTAQAEFVAECERLFAARKIKCDVDTCGYCKRDRFDKLIPYTDCFLFDLKHPDSARHAEYTGRDNELILSNLFYLDSAGAKTEIRIPLIPGFNDGENELRRSGEIISRLGNCVGVRVLAYHALARSKYEDLRMPFTVFSQERAGLTADEARKVLGEYVKVLS